MIDTNGGHKVRSNSKNKYDKPVIPNSTAVEVETTPNNHSQQYSRMNKNKKCINCIITNQNVKRVLSRPIVEAV